MIPERLGPEREWGGGDGDQPYRFGRPPTQAQPFPFSVHELARLYLLRLRLGDDRAELRDRNGAEQFDLGAEA